LIHPGEGSDLCSTRPEKVHIPERGEKEGVKADGGGGRRYLFSWRNGHPLRRACRGRQRRREINGVAGGERLYSGTKTARCEKGKRRWERKGARSEKSRREGSLALLSQAKGKSHKGAEKGRGVSRYMERASEQGRSILYFLLAKENEGILA